MARTRRDEPPRGAARDPSPRDVPEDDARPGAFEEALFASLFVEERAERTVSPGDIEAAGGMTVDELSDLWRAFGLPRTDPARPSFTPEEAEALMQLGSLEEVWPEDVRLKVARIYGHALSQVAATEVEVFRAHVERAIRAASPDEVTAIAGVARAYGRLAPVVGPIMLGVHQRWLESVMAQAAVGEATTAEGEERFPGIVDVTLLFCDLIKFTQFTSRHGDLAAAQTAAQLAEVARERAGEGGYLVKELGDGALIAYSDPVAAVRAWTEIVAEAGRRKLPPLHGGVHRGQAVFRGGDYFGSAVNLTSRLVGLAPGRQLYATHPVVRATADRFRWRPRGRRRLAGIPSSVAIFSLIGPERS